MTSLGQGCSPSAKQAGSRSGVRSGRARGRQQSALWLGGNRGMGLRRQTQNCAPASSVQAPPDSSPSRDPSRDPAAARGHLRSADGDFRPSSELKTVRPDVPCRTLCARTCVADPVHGLQCMRPNKRKPARRRLEEEPHLQKLVELTQLVRLGSQLCDLLHLHSAARAMDERT